MDEDSFEIIDEAAEGYHCERVLDMPQSLTRCLQDTDTKGIKVRHKLKFRIQLHNPDGHISEVSIGRRPVSAPKLTVLHSSVLPSQSLYLSHRIWQLTRTTTFEGKLPNRPASLWMSLHTRLLPSTASTLSINYIASWTPAGIAHLAPAVVDQGLHSVPLVAIYHLKTLLL